MSDDKTPEVVVAEINWDEPAPSESKAEDTKEDVPPTIAPEVLSDKILGLVAGARLAALGNIASTVTADQLAQLKHIIAATKTGEFHLLGFARSMAATAWIDERTTAIVSHDFYVVNPADAVSLHCGGTDPPLRSTNDALLRAAWLGIFDKWMDYTAASTMCTHIDGYTLTSSMLAASIVRCMIEGCPLDIGQVISETLSLLVASGRLMENDPVIARLAAELSPDVVCVAELRAGCNGLAAALWLLWNWSNGKSALLSSLAPEDRPLVSAFIGVYKGARVLLENLHPDQIPSHEDALEFVRAIGLPDGLVVDVNDEVAKKEDEDEGLKGEGL